VKGTGAVEFGEAALRIVPELGNTLGRTVYEVPSPNALCADDIRYAQVLSEDAASPEEALVCEGRSRNTWRPSLGR